LAGFSSIEIQKSFNSFHSDVYKANENKKALKTLIYFVMRFAGHNYMANLKLAALRILYRLRL
jgi:anaerobic magnesium-protoporphyrin IX monomethyl ester cyclase